VQLNRGRSFVWHTQIVFCPKFGRESGTNLPSRGGLGGILVAPSPLEMRSGFPSLCVVRAIVPE